MSPKTPKPKRGSAQDHRQDDDDSGNDGGDGSVETADIPGDPQVPDDAGDGDGGGATGGSLSMLRSVNFRKLAFIGAAGVGLYVAWTYYRRMRHRQLVEAGRQDKQQAQEQAQGDAPGGQEEEEIHIPNDPNDPLAADEAAGNAVFEGWEEGGD